MSLLTLLARAYDRLPDAPPYGFSTEKMGFAISLGEDGSATVIDLRGEEKKRPPRMMMVPQPPKKSVNIAPSFLWGNTGYVLGVMPEASKAERVARTHRAFVELHVRLLEGTDDAGLRVFLDFLGRQEQVMTLINALPRDLVGLNLAFVYEPDRLANIWLHDRPAAKEIWRKGSDPAIAAGQVCLVYGDVRPVARLHPRIKGIRNESGKDADSLVSFNLDAFTSYGHEQGDNAPVSEAAAFAYTTALNRFLTKDSGHRIQIGDASTVFWADGSAEAAREAEALFFASYGSLENESSYDQAATKEIKLRLEMIQNGTALAQVAPKLAEGVRFHILGLAPNAARLSVRFHYEDDFGKLVANYQNHLDNLRLEPPPRDGFPPLWRYLTELAVLGKRENVPPNLAGDWMGAILTGQRYPMTLLTTTLMRLRGDGDVNALRAGILKSVLIRNLEMKEVPVAGQLTLHADRGGAMRSKPVALLLADLGVVKTHSRPYVSNDNPFSEAHFRTLKYCPQFPDRFGSIEDGRAFGQEFFRWYNQDHRHSGLGFLTPAVVHFGHAEVVRAHRDRVLAAAYARHPERFVNGRPQSADLPTAVWINPPVKNPTRQDAPGATIVKPEDPQHGRIVEATHRSTRIKIAGGAPLINSILVSQCH